MTLLQTATHVFQEFKVYDRKILRKIIPPTLTISKHVRERNVKIHKRTRKNFLLLDVTK